ncbi:hypothetical protein ACFQ3Z_34060 [Streptomyces nogalater]
MDDFVFVSGRLSLDLAGTLLWRRSRASSCCVPRRPGALDPAGGPARRSRPAGPPRPVPDVPSQEAVYALVRAWPPTPAADDEVREALAEVNEAARLPLPRHQLDEGGR